jgi:hypothetical protein
MICHRMTHDPLSTPIDSEAPGIRFSPTPPFLFILIPLSHLSIAAATAYYPDEYQKSVTRRGEITVTFDETTRITALCHCQWQLRSRETF